MDTTDPNIEFDAEGVCNHCRDYARLAQRAVISGDEGLRRLRALAGQIQRDGAGKPYDCVIGVSGGVDSTYVAYKVKQLGLRPIAVHLDNGWDSEIATQNISVTLKNLGIDLDTLVIDWEEFKDIQLAFLRAGVPDCEIPSDHAIVSSVYHTARRLRIHYTIWGYNARTETHLPCAWSQGHYDWGYIKAIHRRYGSGRIRTFPHLTLASSIPGLGFAHNSLNLLDYVDYNKKEAMEFLDQKLGWRSYGGKHHESIYTRWYQGWFLPARFGYDKRKTHLSSLICSGEISRDEALQELERPAYSPELQRSDTEYVLKKFGLTSSQFNEIMTCPKRSFHDFPSYGKLRQSASFRAAHQAYRLVKYDLLRFRKTEQ